MSATVCHVKHLGYFTSTVQIQTDERVYGIARRKINMIHNKNGVISILLGANVSLSFKMDAHNIAVLFNWFHKIESH